MSESQQADGVRRLRCVVATGLAGAVLLGVSLRIEPGSVWFHVAALALALVWAGGALASGPLHLGGAGPLPTRRNVVGPILMGLALAALFTLGGLVVREIDPLAEQVRGVLAYSTDASLGLQVLLVALTALNAVGEELFFRGALMEVLTRQRLLFSTLLYTMATAASGNIMLTFAAVLLGVVAGLQREATGGVLAPILTHATWSLTMLAVLPWLFL